MRPFELLRSYYIVIFPLLPLVNSLINDIEPSIHYKKSSHKTHQFQYYRRLFYCITHYIG